MGEMSFQVKVAEIREDSADVASEPGVEQWQGRAPLLRSRCTLARPPPRGVTVGAAHWGAARSEALGQWLQSVAKLDPLCALGAGFTEHCSDSLRASSVV